MVVLYCGGWCEWVWCCQVPESVTNKSGGEEKYLVMTFCPFAMMISFFDGTIMYSNTSRHAQSKITPSSIMKNSGVYARERGERSKYAPPQRQKGQHQLVWIEDGRV